MIHFLAPRRGMRAPLDYIRRGGIESRADVLAYEEVLDRNELPYGLYIFTGINRLGPALSELLEQLWRQLEQHTGLPPLNHPLHSLRRYELLRELHRRGWNRFNAYGAWEDFRSVSFPAFVRPREADGGSPTVRTSMKQLEADIGRAMMQGWGLEDLLIVEFDDTSVDGLFYKYSAYVVGNRIIPVSVDRGSHWIMRRHASEMTEELMLEEREYVQRNPHEEQLREIFDLARISFGRMDYALRDGRVTCWEINTLPTLRRPPGVSRLPRELEVIRKPRKEMFKRSFQLGFETLMQDVSGRGPLPIDLDEHLLDDARREVETSGVTTMAGPVPFRRLRRLLRIFKAVLKPVERRILHPLLGKYARFTKRLGSSRFRFDRDSL